MTYFATKTINSSWLRFHLFTPYSLLCKFRVILSLHQCRNSVSTEEFHWCGREEKHFCNTSTSIYSAWTGGEVLCLWCCCWEKIFGGFKTPGLPFLSLQLMGYTEITNSPFVSTPTSVSQELSCILINHHERIWTRKLVKVQKCNKTERFLI